MPPTTVADLLSLLARDPGRPRLTWYGDDGERIELSGAVLGNWVSKTTNLLVEEFDAEPGSRVLLDLPPHWRTVVWALATWRVGATAVLAAAAPAQVDVVVSDLADRRPLDGHTLIGVALPALARRFPGELPPGAIDAAAAVMTYGDTIGWAPTPTPDVAAVLADEVVCTHGDLVAWALAAQPPASGPERVLVVGEQGRLGVTTLAALLGVLAADGSVVLIEHGLGTQLAADPVRAARLRSTERIDRGDLTQ
ncbi:TIGR03089 family protein [Cellulomonas sp.]|uniref:TIGR03089 family protein n=1 Tax=Cellulomonas sp. TaxID=40001 RepID=UPI003BAA6D4D